MARRARTQIVRASTPTIRLSVPRSAPIQKRRRSHRRRGGAGRKKIGLVDAAIAVFAVDWLAALDAVPVFLADAGKEGTIALAAHFLDADKYLNGIETVSEILAFKKFLDSQQGSHGLFGKG